MADKSSAFSATFSFGDNAAPEKGRGYMLRFIRDAKKYVPQFVLLLVCSLLQAYTFIKLPELFGQAADIFMSELVRSVVAEKSGTITRELAGTIIQICIFTVANAVFAYLQGVLSTNISSGCADMLRNKVFAKTYTVNMAYIDVHTHKSIFDTATAYIDIQNRSLNIFISQVISAMILVIAVIIKVFFIDVTLGVVISLTIPLQLVFVNLLESIINDGKAPLYKWAPELSEVCDNMNLLSVTSDVGKITELVVRAEEKKEKMLKKTRIAEFFVQLPSTFIIGVFSALIIYISGGRINENAVTIGAVISVVIYLKKISSPLEQAAAFFSSMKSFSTANRFIYSLLGAADEDSGNTGADRPSRGNIRFENVTFRYPDGEKNIIENFSSEIKDRGITILTGGTGSGKSTVIKLIMRLYSPDSGSIFIGDRDINDIDLRKWRSSFVYIAQNSGLFDGSILSNIIYPDIDADKERIISSCKDAGLEFVDELPEKLNTVIDVRDNCLSGGQVQQILLARAFYHNASFIIFDEAFSHTDTAAEQKIYSSLMKKQNECGVIIISHNTSGSEIPDVEKIDVEKINKEY